MQNTKYTSEFADIELLIFILIMEHMTHTVYPYVSDITKMLYGAITELRMGKVG